MAAGKFLADMGNSTFTMHIYLKHPLPEGLMVAFKNPGPKLTAKIPVFIDLDSEIQEVFPSPVPSSN